MGEEMETLTKRMRVTTVFIHDEVPGYAVTWVDGSSRLSLCAVEASGVVVELRVIRLRGDRTYAGVEERAHKILSSIVIGDSK